MRDNMRIFRVAMGVAALITLVALVWFVAYDKGQRDLYVPYGELYPNVSICADDQDPERYPARYVIRSFNGAGMLGTAVADDDVWAFIATLPFITAVYPSSSGSGFGNFILDQRYVLTETDEQNTLTHLCTQLAAFVAGGGD